MDHRRMVERLCARAPNAVDVEALGECSRGPLRYDPRVAQDTESQAVEEVGQVLTIPSWHLPSCVPDTEVLVTEDDGTARTLRYRRRWPAPGDGLTHHLILVDA